MCMLYNLLFLYFFYNYYSVFTYRTHALQSDITIIIIIIIIIIICCLTSRLALTIGQLGQDGVVRLQSVADALRVLGHHTELVLRARLQVTHLGKEHKNTPC